MSSPASRAVLMHWIQQEKEAEREMAEALTETRLWLDRAKLAQEQGRTDLAVQARDRALTARERHRAAEERLQEARVHKEHERHQLGAAPPVEHQRAAQILQNFQQLGIDPATAELERISEETDAQLALALLKERMTGQAPASAERSEALGGETADPLQALRQRLEADEEGEGSGGA